MVVFKSWLSRGGGGSLQDGKLWKTDVLGSFVSPLRAIYSELKVVVFSEEGKVGYLASRSG